ncbi:cyclin-A1-4-like isoform X2 [Punica granatum]|uniref:Cyclin-A1-4-like isoform X2 n=1 Tax=Punica granatum TaxID=22663 RepID=A0A6P8D5V8_PUNGR|nr:cyclin-A1-4-like isoform X2 [Punica granatum]
MLTRNRLPVADDACKKAAAAKKRAPLANITNQRDVGSTVSVSSLSSSKILEPCAAKVAKTEPPAITHDKIFSKNASLGSKLNACFLAKNTPLATKDGVTLRVTSCPAKQNVEVEFFTPPTADSPLGNGITDTSPCGSEGTISVSETMSPCDSLETLDFGYSDEEDALSTTSGRRTNKSLHISEEAQTPGNISKTGALLDREMIDEIKLKDPQFCATIACDIYEDLRLSEVRKRPSTDFMEGVQKDITASMRAVLIDWLVEVSEEYQFVPETLFLSVNYIDRYLSGNPVNRQRLQLLGVTCMMIAAKYEEIYAPDVEEFCYISDGTYCKEEVLRMESHVLSYLKFEMTAPTANCFLRWFVWAVHEFREDFGLVCYTLYRPSDLCKCVKALHRLCRNGLESKVTAVRKKYSQHKYKFVAKKYCPPSIPQEFFED